MKKCVYFPAVLALLAAATFFVARQRTLDELRAGNESLRQQVESQSGSARSEADTEVASTDSAAPLTAEEKTELLRLRGQIQSLRNEAAEASNRVAGLSQSLSSAAATRKVSPEVEQNNDALAVILHSKPYVSATELAKAVQGYLKQHGGQIPDDLTAVTGRGDESFITNGTLQRFELVRSGSVVEDPALTPFVLIAHDKEPMQMPDGRWVRLYLQANGGVTIAGPLPNKPPLDDSDFIRHTEEMGKLRAQQKPAVSRP